jgi:pyrroline-5-carboxylate reductase
VAEGLAPHLGPEHTLISILAGTTTATLSRCFPTAGAVVRAMPNTPMAAGLGMVGIAPGPGADADTMDLAETVFAPSAKVLRCTEDRIDALTAVSGSGPAYCFLFAEAMMAGAQALGFSADEAQLLVGQTLRGSIAYLDGQEGYPAAQLRSQVTSPGGTTAAALSVFADADFTGLVERALVAARNRGQELAG